MWLVGGSEDSEAGCQLVAGALVLDGLGMSWWLPARVVGRLQVVVEVRCGSVVLGRFWCRCCHVVRGGFGWLGTGVVLGGSSEQVAISFKHGNSHDNDTS